MSEALTHAQLKALRALKTRAQRETQGLFLAEGEHLVQEALQEGLATRLVLAQGRQQAFDAMAQSGLPLSVVPDRLFASLCDTRSPQGVLAVCRLPRAAAWEDLGPRVVALNAVQDPGNVGTILRSADAAGFTGLLMDGDTADAFGPKALRASMGSAFRIPVRVCGSLAEELRAPRGYALVAASLQGTDFYQREALGDQVCLLIGNEGAGLAEELMALCTHVYKLPMRGGAESLNAAVAASIMMYDLLRVREQG